MHGKVPYYALAIPPNPPLSLGGENQDFQLLGKTLTSLCNLTVVPAGDKIDQDQIIRLILIISLFATSQVKAYAVNQIPE